MIIYTVNPAIPSTQRKIDLKRLGKLKSYEILSDYDSFIKNDSPDYYSMTDIIDMILDYEYPNESFE